MYEHLGRKRLSNDTVWVPLEHAKGATQNRLIGAAKRHYPCEGLEIRSRSETRNLCYPEQASMD